MTNTPDSKTLALQITATADRQDWLQMMELVAPTVRVHIGNQDLDRDAWRGFGQMFYAAFPDAKHTIEAVHGSGEYATLIATIRGTHSGAFMGLPPTGRSIAFQVIHVDRFVNGRCVEHTGQFDTAALMQQLAGPPLERARVDELFAAIDRQDFAAVRAIAAPGFAFRIGGQTLDFDGWTGFSKMFFGAFPDGKHVHDEVVIAGNRATVVGAFHGTHRGAFQGIPATGKKVSISYVGIGTFVDGKCAEMRVEIDSAGLMQQLA